MRRYRYFLIAGIMFGFWAAQSFAGPVTPLALNLSTGLDSSGNLITIGGAYDAHWMVGPSTHAQVVAPGNSDWFGGWLPNGSNSDWIAIDANNQQNNTASTYYVTFDLTGYDTSTILLSTWLWTVDDEATLYLNTHLIDSLLNGSWGSFHTVPTIPTSYFNQGQNNLSVVWGWTDNYLEAVRLEGTLTAEPLATTPEPSSLLLLATGLVGMVGAIRRKKA